MVRRTRASEAKQERSYRLFQNRVSENPFVFATSHRKYLDGQITFDEFKGINPQFAKQSEESFNASLRNVKNFTERSEIPQVRNYGLSIENPTIKQIERKREEYLRTSQQVPLITSQPSSGIDVGSQGADSEVEFEDEIDSSTFTGIDTSLRQLEVSSNEVGIEDRAQIKLRSQVDTKLSDMVKEGKDLIQQMESTRREGQFIKVGITMDNSKGVELGKQKTFKDKSIEKVIDDLVDAIEDKYEYKADSVNITITFYS